ncbi:hypothetical protein FOCC_FOCC008763 [Frankliniella occidentalis]|nr:hypothetical protein FOCC_FOCC008763 [Frankliniella occidentalis]
MIKLGSNAPDGKIKAMSLESSTRKPSRQRRHLHYPTASGGLERLGRLEWLEWLVEGLEWLEWLDRLQWLEQLGGWSGWWVMRGLARGEAVVRKDTLGMCSESESLSGSLSWKRRPAALALLELTLWLCSPCGSSSRSPRRPQPLPRPSPSTLFSDDLRWWPRSTPLAMTCLSDSFLGVMGGAVAAASTSSWNGQCDGLPVSCMREGSGSTGEPAVAATAMARIAQSMEAADVVILEEVSLVLPLEPPRCRCKLNSASPIQKSSGLPINWHNLPTQFMSD